MEFDRLIEAFGESIGLPGLTAAADGAVYLAFDHVQLSLRLAADPAYVDIDADLGLIAANNVQLAARLLNANHYGDGAGGGTLALSANYQCILHRRRALAGLDVAGLTRQLEFFVDHAEHWGEQIRTPQATAFDTNAPAYDYDFMRV